MQFVVFLLALACWLTGAFSLVYTGIACHRLLEYLKEHRYEVWADLMAASRHRFGNNGVLPGEEEGRRPEDPGFQRASAGDTRSRFL